MEKLTLTVPGHSRAQEKFEQVLMAAYGQALLLSAHVDRCEDPRLVKPNKPALNRQLNDLISGYGTPLKYDGVAHYIDLLNHLLENISYCRMDSRLVTGYVYTELLGNRAPIKYKRVGHLCGATSEPGSIFSSDTSSLDQWLSWTPVHACPGCVIRVALEEIADLLVVDIMRLASVMYVNGLIDVHGNTDMHITGCKGDVLILEDHSYHARQLPALL